MSGFGFGYNPETKKTVSNNTVFKTPKKKEKVFDLRLLNAPTKRELVKDIRTIFKEVTNLKLIGAKSDERNIMEIINI